MNLLDINNIKDILTFACTILTLIAFAYSLIIVFMNKFKKHKTIGEEKQNAKALTLLKSIIPQAVKNAEKCGLVNGNLKNIMALSEIIVKCEEEEIDFDTYKEFIKGEIEDLIKFSKEVNTTKVEEVKTEETESEEGDAL